MANKKFVTYREESKTNYGKDKEILPNGNTESATHEQVNVGSLQRIADATELMAKNYSTLVFERNSFENLYKAERVDNERMARRIAALKGVITKLKRWHF